MQRHLGQHELLIRLAAGGAANVFLVRDLEAPAPGRLLALKILLPSLAANEDFLRMFFAEARIAARINHPHVVAITGFGQVEGIYCLAMEYVFGASLAQVLRASARAKRPLTVGTLLRITAMVCDALHYAHELKDEVGGKSLGIVHRDVTPQNILIGFNGVPKLTDFGIAKATNRGWETQAGIVKGKFSYMSPEQALGKKVDRRSDIFCTGIVLWEALTGRELFKGATPMEVLAAVREQKIQPPSEVVPGLTPIVDPIVMKALRRAPKSRYQTAAEMQHDIEDLIRRAGVTIDSSTISKEFAAIYGDEIAERALALRNAMAGRADLAHLAKVLGGTMLNPGHLPVIPNGLSNPDPLGLFSVAEPALTQPPETSPALSVFRGKDDSGVTVTRDHSSALRSQDLPFESPHEVSIVLEDEIKSLEDTQEPNSVFEQSLEGWDENTAIEIPKDDLLSMISEEDATVGFLPPAFAERLGVELQRSPESHDEDDTRAFDDEMTVGVPGGGPSLSLPEVLAGVDEPTPPPRTAERYQQPVRTPEPPKHRSDEAALPSRAHTSVRALPGFETPRSESQIIRLDMPKRGHTVATPMPKALVERATLNFSYGLFFLLAVSLLSAGFALGWWWAMTSR